MFEQLGQGAIVVTSFIPGIALGLAACVSLSHRGTKGDVGELKVNAALAEGGYDVMADILIPAPNGNLTQIDHIVRLPGAIAVIETKAYRGTISRMAEDGSAWIQTLGRQSDEIASPIAQNSWHVNAVKRIVGNHLPVLSFICFSGDARFDDQPPNGVYPHPEAMIGVLDDIRQRYAQKITGISDAEKGVQDPAEAAWAKLAVEARRDGEAQQKHRKQTGAAREFSKRASEAVVLLIGSGVAFAAAWSFWNAQIL